MNENEKLINEIVSMLRCDSLAGRPFEDCCTDGYDTHYVLLAQEIVRIVKIHKDEKKEV